VLSSDSLTNILLAIATGYPDRAHEVISSSEEIDDAAREVLLQALELPSDPSTSARRLGDGLRSLGADRNQVNECYRTAFYAGEEWKALSGNPLFSFFAANKAGNPLDKWIHYFPIYDQHLARYRGLPVRVLEIGVYRGGGLELLRHYLGPAAHLVGIDIDEAARVAIEPRHAVELGDQADPDFLRRVSAKHGPFDIVLDDGGHFMSQQIISVETLFPLLAEGATYVVEDCHTSYWPEYSDGNWDRGTFVAWAKERIDDMHAYHFSKEKDLVAPWQTDLIGMHLYDSVVVLDKSRRSAPFCEVSGTKDFINHDRLAVATEAELVATRNTALARAAKETAANEARAAELDARADDLVELDELRLQTAELEQTRIDLHGAWAVIRVMRRSKSWRLTAPIRGIKRIVRRP
jgi:hypothetical protein